MKILITVPFTEEQEKRLRAQMPGAEYMFTTRVKASDKQIREADVILGNLPVARLAQAANLKWLQLNSSGADAYAAEGALAPEVILTNATGAYGLAISEHLLAATFFLKKKLGLYFMNQKNREWKDEGQVTAISGSRTLVIGLGSIGGDYARKMALLGSRVVGIRRTKAECPDYLEEIGTFEDIDRFLPEADIVALALPNTPQTYHIMNEERLLGMKRGSILLNVGRGTAIDTDPEPLPEDHPLWRCENLLLTPHIAGDYHLQETLDQIVELFIDNLGRYAKGRELKNPVDKKTGYRKTQ